MTKITIKTFEQHGENFPVSEEIAARLPAKAVKEWKFGYEPLDTRAYLSIATGLPDLVEKISGRTMAAMASYANLLQPYVAQAERVLAIEAALKEWDRKLEGGAELPVSRENVMSLPYRVIMKLGNIMLGREMPEELLEAYDAEAASRKRIADEKNA